MRALGNTAHNTRTISHTHSITNLNTYALFITAITTTNRIPISLSQLLISTVWVAPAPLLRPRTAGFLLGFAFLRSPSW